MIIKDIQHIKTGETRTDGRYPLRIGCTIRIEMATSRMAISKLLVSRTFSAIRMI